LSKQLRHLGEHGPGRGSGKKRLAHGEDALEDTRVLFATLADRGGIREQLTEAVATPKCHKCRCLQQTVETLETSSPDSTTLPMSGAS
jgi:hypothetical protein